MPKTNQATSHFLFSILQVVFISIVVDWRLRIAFFTCVILMYLAANVLPSVLANAVSNQVSCLPDRAGLDFKPLTRDG